MTLTSANESGTPDPLAHDRRIRFEAVFNARDLGGLPTSDRKRTVRRGLVFRADGVHRLDGADLEVARALGLRTVIDLRTRGEVERGRFPEALGATWHHLPFITEMWSERELVIADGPVPFLRDRYLEMLVEGQASRARALELVAEATPLLFHCAAGKDRTGVMAAVVLGLLGVANDDIAADYHLSAAAMTEFTAWITAAYPEAIDSMTNQPKEYLEAPAEAMHQFLDRIDAQHGSMEGLVDAIGIHPAVVTRMRENLLE